MRINYEVILMVFAKKWRIFIGCGIFLLLMGLVLMITGSVLMSRKGGETEVSTLNLTTTTTTTTSPLIIKGDSTTGYAALVIVGTTVIVLGILIVMLTLFVKRKKDRLFPTFGRH